MQPKYAKNYLREFLRILAPDGILIFQMPGDILIRNEKGNINLQGIILRFVPKKVLDETYRKIRYGNQPRMEMYVIKARELEDFLHRNGARIISIRNNRGPIFLDCRYIVNKA
jgi:SAM-dependent methyltransferase